MLRIRALRPQPHKRFGGTSVVARTAFCFLARSFAGRDSGDSQALSHEALELASAGILRFDSGKAVFGVRPLCRW